MTRTEIINSLIKKNKYSSYLEIGVSNPEFNFNHINCNYKIGVDISPLSEATYIMSSDQFFADCKETFDIIFIDGLHTGEQVKKDIDNSLKILNINGTIVCHDMNPYTEDMQKNESEVTGVSWTGDVWKEWVRLRKTNSNLNMFVVDTDFGVGIIQKGTQELLVIDDNINYKNFEINKKSWLNLILTDDFINIL